MDMGITTDLIARCRQENTDAQMQLYRLCYARLIGICRRYENRDHDAGALFNNGFFKVLKGLSKHEFQTEDAFMYWARRVMINDMIDTYRRGKRHHQLQYPTDFAETQIEPNTPALNTGALGMDAEYLLQIISELPEIQRQVFNMHALDDYPHKEIAEVLGMTEGTSKWYLSEARKTLRKKIAQLQKRNNNNITKVKI